MKKPVIRYGVLFVVGFCLYTTIEVLFRGFSYWQSGVIGGIALILIGRLNNEISWDFPLFWQCIVGGGIVTLLELMVGTYDRLFWHIHMWDYSHIPLNYRGIICLPFSVAWCGLALVAVLLDDCIEYYMFHGDVQPYYRSVTGYIMFALPLRKCEKGGFQ